MPPARDRSERTRRADDHYRAGRQFASTYRPQEAVRELRRAIRLLAGSTEPEHVELRVRALISLAYSESEVRTYASSVRLLDAARAELAGIPDPVLRLQLAGQARTQSASVLYRFGRLADASAAYGEAVADHERAHSLGAHNETALGRTLMNWSVACIELGDPVTAERGLRRCVEITESAVDDPNHAGALAVLSAKARHALGSLAWRVGDVPLALRHMETANERYLQLSPAMLPKLRKDQADVLLTAGLSEEAARYLDEALPELRRLRDYQNLAEAEVVRAGAAMVDGEYALARRYAAAARRGFLRRDNATWAGIAALTGLRAAVGAALSRDPDAGGRTAGVPAALPRRALELAAELDRRRMPDESALARLLAVRLHLRRGEVAAAEHGLALVPRLRQVTPIDHHMLRRLCRAELAVARGDRRRALRQAGTALAELARVRDRMGGLELLSGTAVHGRELGELAVKLVLDAPRTAGRTLFGWLERTRAQVYRYEPLPPTDNPLLTQRVGEYRALTRQLQSGPFTGAAGQPLRARHAALEREVMRLGWRDGPWGRPRPTATLEQVGAALGERVLVSYVVSGPELAAVVVAGGRARLVRLGPVAPVVAAVRELHADLDALAPDSLPDPLVVAVTDSARRRAAGLAETLLAPWADLLGDRELVVVPTGDLYAVAWHVLPSLTGRPVSVAPSATAWLGAQRGSGAADRNRPTALVGAPGLAAAIGEVSGLRAHHPDARLLSGPDATVAAVLAALDGAGLAHVAAHGAHEPENALFSKLELADGPLFAHEVARLARPPEQVVLAACELALSRIRPGDEALGFAGALLSAGVRTVTAAVTRVGDVAAARTMTDYHRLLAAGAPPAHALAEATAVDPYRRPFVSLGANPG